MTLYYDVQIGTWGGSNSTVKAYVDYGDGEGYRQWINAPSYNLVGADPGWGLTDFTSYSTGKTTSAPSPATYSTWYDELILSTQPIAPPGGTGGVIDGPRDASISTRPTGGCGCNADAPPGWSLWALLLIVGRYCRRVTRA
jgi:hypothetical protein